MNINTKRNAKKIDFSFDAMLKTGFLRRLSITLGLLIFYRFCVHIPLPDINHEIFRQHSNMLTTGILGMVDLFAGGALSALSIFALGIGPFITSSIMMQLLAEVFPSIKALNREHGEEGRKKYQQYSRYLSVFLAALQGFALAKYLSYAHAEILNKTGQSLLFDSSILFIFKIVLILTVGSLFIMWLGELISEFGIGNGASLLIFAGIAARLPQLIIKTYETFKVGSIPVWGILLVLATFCLVIFAIIAIQEGSRKLLIVGAKNYSVNLNQAHYLPLKINPAGVLPIIFASMTMFVPIQILNFLGQQNVNISTGTYNLFKANKFLGGILDSIYSIDIFKKALIGFGSFIDRTFLVYSSWEHSLFYFALILMFAFFYASILLPSNEIAENLQKGGSSIQGIKPGKPTAEYLEWLLNRLTFIGGTTIALITILPLHIEKLGQVNTLGGLGSTSLIIMVGVAIDLYNQTNSYLQAHQYKKRSLF